MQLHDGHMLLHDEHSHEGVHWVQFILGKEHKYLRKLDLEICLLYQVNYGNYYTIGYNYDSWLLCQISIPS